MGTCKALTSEQKAELGGTALAGIPARLTMNLSGFAWLTWVL